MTGCVSGSRRSSLSGNAVFSSLRTSSTLVVGRDAKQESFGGAAAGQHQSGAVQAVAGYQHAGPTFMAAGMRSGSFAITSGDRERLAAEADAVARLQCQAQHQVVAKPLQCIAVQSAAQVARADRAGRAVEGILRRDPRP